MSTPARVAAAAVIGVLLVGGTLFVFDRTRSDRRSAGRARRRSSFAHARSVRRG